MHNEAQNTPLEGQEDGVKYPVRAFLDISPLYVSPKTRQWLHSTMCRIPTDGPILGGPMPYGWFIWAPEDIEADNAAFPGIPKDLQRVLAYARERKCDYVLFDADAPPDAHPDLPTWPDEDAPVEEVNRHWRVVILANATDVLETSVVVQAPNADMAEDIAWEMTQQSFEAHKFDWKHVVAGKPEEFSVGNVPTIEVSDEEALLDSGGAAPD